MPEPLSKDIGDVRMTREFYCTSSKGGGHTWPGGLQYFPERMIGKTTHNLDASEEIVDFFKRH
jgi:poly(3-hydroxybutyrate) depolymerase